MVASRATMSEMMERLIMMIHSLFSGFHSSAGISIFSRSIVADEADDAVAGTAMETPFIFLSDCIFSVTEILPRS